MPLLQRQGLKHARCRITDERTGDTYDYGRRTDLYGHFILAPVNAPEHIVKDSTALWNEVERVERQNNGQTARYFDVAIPTELNNDDKKKLVLEYCQKNFVEKGMIADIAFHACDQTGHKGNIFFRFKDVYYFYSFHCMLLLVLYKKHHFLLKKIQFNFPFRTGLLPVYYSLLKRYLSYELTLMCCRTATP